MAWHKADGRNRLEKTLGHAYIEGCGAFAPTLPESGGLI